MTSSAVSVLLLITALLQAACTQRTIAPVIIQSSDSTGMCPSTEERQTAIEMIQNDIEDRVPRVVTECGDGLWYRVAYFNVNDPTQNCPSAWREYMSNSVRVCGRPVSSSGSCTATIYTIGDQYSKVCGRVIGYQFASPDGFYNRNIDQVYADGISVTYGTPRNHIWTFAAGVTEGSTLHTLGNCPCSSAGAIQPPSFIGSNYYCESANPTDSFSAVLYNSDKLWDGQQCADEGTCCTGPPWFSVELPNNSMDDIEVRICGDEATDNEDTPVELLELYVQ